MITIENIFAFDGDLYARRATFLAIGNRAYTNVLRVA